MMTSYVTYCWPHLLRNPDLRHVMRPHLSHNDDLICYIMLTWFYSYCWPQLLHNATSFVTYCWPHLLHNADPIFYILYNATSCVTADLTFSLMLTSSIWPHLIIAETCSVMFVQAWSWRSVSGKSPIIRLFIQACSAACCTGRISMAIVYNL